MAEAQLPGESTLQYMLRIGMDPNTASATLTQGSTGNTMATAPTLVQNAIKRSQTPGKTFQGFDMSDPTSPYYVKPITLSPSGATDGWVGQEFQKYPTSGIIDSGAAPTAAPTAGTTTPTTGAVPNSGGPGWGSLTVGAAINAGETPQDYMIRIGMTGPQIHDALTMAQANPTMTFQQIYAALGLGGSGTSSTEGAGGNLTYGGAGPSYVPPGTNPPISGGTATGLNPPGEGMWSGNTVPSVGTPGTPGYQPGHNIAPNIVDTTRFANPNPTYNPTSTPISPLSTPTNPATMPQIDPTTGQVVTSGQYAGTVQGQLDNILKDGNPLLEAARTRAAQAANQRGLINSSMAAQAGEEAVLNAALPIAQQDAQTMENRALVNQNITNQFLSMREGTRLDLQKAYEAFKQNNYAFDKNAALQTYLNDSGISNQQKIAALQAAVSQANTATQVQGELERTGMTLTAQQWLTNNVPSTALMQIGATNLANYASGLANIMSSQLEPDAKANALANWNAVWAGQNLGGLVINGVQALPVDPLAGAPVNSSPTASVP